MDDGVCADGNVSFEVDVLTHDCTAVNRKLVFTLACELDAECSMCYKCCAHGWHLLRK